MSKKFYVGNLPFSATEEQVKIELGILGNILSVKLINDRETQKPRGFGFVEFENDISISNIPIITMDDRKIVIKEAIQNHKSDNERKFNNSSRFNKFENSDRMGMRHNDEFSSAGYGDRDRNRKFDRNRKNNFKERNYNR